MHRRAIDTGQNWRVNKSENQIQDQQSCGIPNYFSADPNLSKLLIVRNRPHAGIRMALVICLGLAAMLVVFCLYGSVYKLEC